MENESPPDHVKMHCIFPSDQFKVAFQVCFMSLTEGDVASRGVIRSRIPSRERTVSCATGTTGGPSAGWKRNARTRSARINGPSAMAKPAPGQTRGPAENGI